MLKSVLLFIFIFQFIGVYAQEKSQKIRVCSISKVSFDAQAGNKKILLSKIFYNKNGRIVKEKNFTEDAPFTESFYFYQDSLLYLQQIYDTNACPSNINYFYENGLLVEKNEILERDIYINTLFRYSNNGNLLLRQVTEFRKGLVSNRSTLAIKYNSKGQQSEKLLINNDDTLEIAIFEYDDKLTLVKSVEYCKNGNVENIEEYKYDSLGRLVTKIITNSGQVVRVEDFIYDKKLIKSVVYRSRNGNIIFIENRVYNQSELLKVEKIDRKFGKKEVEFYEGGQIKRSDHWEGEDLVSSIVYTYENF